MRALLLCVLGGCGACDDTALGAHLEASVPFDAMQVDGAAGSNVRLDASPSASTSFDDLPDAGAIDLDTRAKHLLEAIAENDAALAADIVLPRDAYMTARDTQDPGALYESKFKTGFATHVARAHRHEHGMERAVFVSFELGQTPSRVTPKKHEWKEPLWHVTRSTLTFTIDGRVHRIEVAEMIAWRGNWYVSHLHDAR